MSVVIRSSDRGFFGDRDDAGVVEGDTLHSSRDLLNICVKIQEGRGGRVQLISPDSQEGRSLFLVSCPCHTSSSQIFSTDRAGLVVGGGAAGSPIVCQV